MELYNVSKFVKQISADLSKYKQTNTIVDAQVHILLNMLTETVTKQLGIIEYTNLVNSTLTSEKQMSVVVPELTLVLPKTPVVALPLVPMPTLTKALVLPLVPTPTLSLIKAPFVALPITTKRKLEELHTETNYLYKIHTMYWQTLYEQDCLKFNNIEQIEDIKFLYYTNHKLVKYNKFIPLYCLLSKDGHIYTVDSRNNLILYYAHGIKQKWQYGNKYVKHT